MPRILRIDATRIVLAYEFANNFSFLASYLSFSNVDIIGCLPLFSVNDDFRIYIMLLS